MAIVLKQLMYRLIIVFVGSLPLSAIAQSDFTGMWKGKCVDQFGIQIKPTHDGAYAITFCGPGGCIAPGAWTPDTRIEGDPAYRIVSSVEIDVRRKDDPRQYFRYRRCSEDPTWRRSR